MIYEFLISEIDKDIHSRTQSINFSMHKWFILNLIYYLLNLIYMININNKNLII